LRVRALAGAVARAYLESRQALGFPLLQRTAASPGASVTALAEAGQ
jgi:hypothetical protein